MISVGMTVDNRYKILREIGRGGTSCVYLAENTRVHNYWAIKEVYKNSITGEGIESKTLIAESSLLTKLRHPGLPSIIDVIDCEQTFLIVMEYIDGISLDKLLTEKGAQSEKNVLKWGQQICDVLEYIHGQQPSIIYRDMKPANVMLKPDGNIVLIDFGMAREFKRYNTHDTTMLGTHGYAAPEQYSGNRQSDARTDIYGLGVTLYHLVTGHDPCQPPYGINSICSINPSLSPQLDQIIQKCTKLEPDMRYQTARELNNALKSVGQNNGNFNNFDARNNLNNFNNINNYNNANNNRFNNNFGGNNFGGANNNFGGANNAVNGYNYDNKSTDVPVDSASIEVEEDVKKSNKWLWFLAIIPVVIILLIVAIVLGISKPDQGTDPGVSPGFSAQYDPGENSDDDTIYYSQEVIINEPDKREYYTLTPDVTGNYEIYSVSGSVKPVIWVSDENDNVIGQDNTSGEYNDFRLTCYLVAGETYYFETTLYDLDANVSPTGSYWIYVDYKGNTP